MTSIDESHVYERALQVDKRTSLALLVGMVDSGSSVLDVGIGGGALGAYLRQNKNCVVDGLTYNAEEAALAAGNYRSIHVADLDVSRVSDWFGSQRYDCVVCADVLEHLRDPGRVLDDARQLLAEGGKLLISVPNVAYAGLIAELLGGEFNYRREGLLDQTHVRFFTRNSLLRFLAEHGWRVKRIETVELDLADSEFAPALDALSPAVRTQLMANPDGATYQFVMEVEPCPPGVLTDHSEHLHDSVQAMMPTATTSYTRCRAGRVLHSSASALCLHCRIWNCMACAWIRLNARALCTCMRFIYVIVQASPCGSGMVTLASCRTAVIKLCSVRPGWVLIRVRC